MKKTDFFKSSLTAVLVFVVGISFGQTNHINVTGTTTGVSGDIYHLGGNVGIGVDNPAYKLDVAGSITSRWDNTESAFNHLILSRGTNLDYSNRELRFQQLATGGLYHHYLLYNGRISGDTYPPTYTQGAWGSISGIEFGHNQINFLMNTSGAGTGSNTIVSPEKIMTIYNNGNVGIGNSNPSANLEIKGRSGQSNNYFMIHAADVGEILKVNPSKELELFGAVKQTNTSTTGNLYNIWSSNSYSILKSNIYNDAWGRNSTQTLRHGGTIAAPTVAPANAPIYEISNAVYDGSGYIQTSHMLFQAEGAVNAGSAKGRIIFSTNDGTTTPLAEERMRLTPDGRLGIGTTAPGAKLDVRGNLILETGTYPVLYTGTGPDELNRYLQLINSPEKTTASGLKVGGLLVASSYGWASPGKNDLIVAGNVGIGTANPEVKLDVRGNLVLESGNNPVLYTGTGTEELNRYLQLINSPENGTASGLKIGGLLVADAYGWASPGKNDLIVKGNVGIGTTTPDYKLTVNGVIHAQRVKVTANAGADFVFEEGYNLKDLNEVEAFVTENKHLPEVPSAAEMIEEGVDMGEMQIKLLQKIEELTLYVIDLKKENEVMKAEIETLKVAGH